MAKKQDSILGALTEELSRAFAGRAIPGVQIIDEPVPASRYRHITVIWEKWKGVAQQDRGKVILDAFQSAHPTEPWRSLEITLALGLTSSEAQKLNLKIA